MSPALSSTNGVFHKQEDRSAKGRLDSVGTMNFGGDLTTFKTQVLRLMNHMQSLLLLISRAALSPQVEGLTSHEVPRNQTFPVMIKGEKSKGLWDLN